MTDTPFASTPTPATGTPGYGSGGEPTGSDKAKAAASTAADEGRHVAGVAQGEAQRVAGEASTQVRSLVGEARTQVTSQVGDQSRVQKDKLATTLTSLGDDLEKMVNGEGSGSGLAADAAREITAQVRKVTDFLETREPGDLLDDARSLARRRPAAFLVGALAAGVIAGRVARGVKDADSTGSASGSAPSYVPPTGMAGTYATPTTPPPAMPPVVPPTTTTTTTTTATQQRETLSDAGLGTDAAGYGERSGLPGSTP